MARGDKSAYTDKQKRTAEHIEESYQERGLSATMRNIRQNLFLAFAYNAVGVPVAAGVLYPIFGVMVSPIWASAAMTLSSLSVMTNALRLRRAAG